jgi:hypothetical protein
VEEHSDPEDSASEEEEEETRWWKEEDKGKMLYTECKAKIVVKLIDNRWCVINFVPDHNHDLVFKPLLKKFLRSHKGIPKP